MNKLKALWLDYKELGLKGLLQELWLDRLLTKEWKKISDLLEDKS